MDKRVAILMSAAAVVGGLIGFALGGPDEGDVECLTLLGELESAAYQPQSSALEAALQETRAYLQEQR